MTALAVSFSLGTGAISSSQFNTNYADIVDYINARNSGATAWDNFYSTSSTTIPLVADNLTGTQSIAQFKNNGSTVGEVFNNGLVSFSSQEFVYAAASAFQSLTTHSAEKLINLAVQSQTHSSMDSSGKFTAQQAGKYLVIATLDKVISSVGGNKVDAYIYKNGSSYASKTGISNFPVSEGIFVYDIVDLAINDTIEIYARCDVTTLTVGGGAGTSTTVCICKLS